MHLVNLVKHNSEEGLKRLETAKQILLQGGFDPICQILRGDTEKAIAAYVEENQINLLIMGAYGDSRIRHLVIGSTTAQMLSSCKIPVLLFR